LKIVVKFKLKIKNKVQPVRDSPIHEQMNKCSTVSSQPTKLEGFCIIYSTS